MIQTNLNRKFTTSPESFQTHIQPLVDLPWHGHFSKILARSWHDSHFAIVRFYQESHVPRKNFEKPLKPAFIWYIRIFQSQTGEDLLGFSSEFRKPEYVIVIFRTILHANFFQQVSAFWL